MPQKKQHWIATQLRSKRLTKKAENFQESSTIATCEDAMKAKSMACRYTILATSNHTYIIYLWLDIIHLWTKIGRQD